MPEPTRKELNQVVRRLRYAKAEQGIAVVRALEDKLAVMRIDLLLVRSAINMRRKLNRKEHRLKEKL